MNADTEIDLDALHQAIVDAIAGQFPDLVTVEDYREDRKALPLPACLVELTDMERDPDEGPDPGTEQLAMVARFEAQLVIGFRTASAKREIRKLAAALATFVNLNRWGLPIGPARVIGCQPDDFEPELDQYEVWTVEWAQTIHLGATVWTNEGTIPTDVFVAYNAEDPSDESEYQPLEPEE